MMSRSFYLLEKKAIHPFFRIPVFNRNVQPKICQNIKNMLRTYSRLREEQSIFSLLLLSSKPKTSELHNVPHGIRDCACKILFFQRVWSIHLHSVLVMGYPRALITSRRKSVLKKAIAALIKIRFKRFNTASSFKTS